MPQLVEITEDMLQPGLVLVARPEAPADTQGHTFYPTCRRGEVIDLMPIYDNAINVRYRVTEPNALGIGVGSTRNSEPSLLGVNYLAEIPDEPTTEDPTEDRILEALLRAEEQIAADPGPVVGIEMSDISQLQPGMRLVARPGGDATAEWAEITLINHEHGLVTWRSGPRTGRATTYSPGSIRTTSFHTMQRNYLLPPPAPVILDVAWPHEWRGSSMLQRMPQPAVRDAITDTHDWYWVRFPNGELMMGCFPGRGLLERTETMRSI